MIFFFEIRITKYMLGSFYVLRVSRERFEVLESYDFLKQFQLLSLHF